MALSAEEAKRAAYLTKELSIFKAKVEKLGQYIEGINVAPLNAKSRLDFLATMYNAAVRYSDELASLQPENPEVEAFELTESRYYELSGAVSELQQPVAIANSTMAPGNITITERQDLPKLPKIKIPQFDGKRENWANYKNKFIALIDSRTDISDAVKCSQLFDSLTGQALTKVDRFDPCDTDYPKAWKTLLDFYDHKRIVAVEHLNAILDLPQLTRESADELTSLIDKACQHLHILEGLGARSGDDFVVRIIERCLPAQTRRKWQDKLDMDELPKLEALIKFVQATIFKQQATDSSSPAARNPKKRAGGPFPHSVSKSLKTSAQTLVTSVADSPSSSSSSSRENRPLICPKCKESHRLFKCPDFNRLSVQERWNLIKNIKACKNCLWVHPLPCKSDHRCKKCQQNHHTLLHREQNTNQPRSRDPTPTLT